VRAGAARRWRSHTRESTAIDSAHRSIHVLGPVEVWHGELRAPLTRSQSRHFVALLASAPRQWLSTDILIDDLWPDEMAGKPRSTLQVLVRRVREAIRDDDRQLVAHDGDGYGLNRHACSIDLVDWEAGVEAALRCRHSDPQAALERLTAAKALWKGRPFDGVTSSARLDAARMHLESVRVDAGVCELDVLRLLDPPAAAHQATRVIDLAPLREDVVLAAVQAMTAAGRFADALDLINDFRRHLRAELGLSPSQRMLDAEQEALNPRRIAVPASTVAPDPLPTRRPTERTLSGIDVLGCLECADVAFHERDYEQAAAWFSEAAVLAEARQDRLRALVGEGLARERLGERITAGALFAEVIASADPACDADFIVEAALGGSGLASHIGGDADRRQRLQVALTRLGPHERRDELIADLALESFNNRQRLGDEIRSEVDRVAASESSPGHLLALRWQVAEREVTNGATVQDANQLGTLALARSRESLHHASAAFAVAVGVAAAAGGLEDAERWAAEFAYLGEQSGEPRARWQALAFCAVLEEIRGRTDRADEMAQRALSVGQSLDMPDAEATFGLHLIGRAVRSDSLAPFAPLLASALDRYRYPLWGMMRGAAELDAGNDGVAAELLSTHLDDALTWLDHFRPATLAFGALLAGRLGSHAAIDSIAAAIEGRAGRFALIGYGGPCVGPFDMYRAELARGRGDIDEARRLLTAARDTCRRAGAYGWVEPIDRRISSLR